MLDRNVLVVGAGPAGLGVASELGRLGVRTTVLEQAGTVGAAWRGRYDRLRLNSSRWFSNLPGQRHPKGSAVFPSRDEMIAYLEGYARDQRVDVRVNTRVERIDRDGDRWALHTSAGELPAEQVIVSSGYAHTPYIPDWPGRERYEGVLFHAAAYRNPDPFRDRDVLVVGPGCSGMEIAYDLVQGGAGRVRLAVRTPPNIIIRNPIGPLLARGIMKLGPRRADRVMSFVRRREIGDLTEYGLPEPEEGIISRLLRLGVAPAIVDKEVIEAIKERRSMRPAFRWPTAAGSSPRRWSPPRDTAAAWSPSSATSACSTSAECRWRQRATRRPPDCASSATCRARLTSA
jgi:putative flavoprotein involved in K+ transport